MKVALYARVSTKDKDQSPENQFIRLRAYCESKGWIYEEYNDFASGSKKERLGLKLMMDDLTEYDGVLVLRLDRFGRSLSDLISLLERIKKKGKFFEAVDQGLRISDKKDPMNDFMFGILGAAAQFERELISERVRDGMARARKEGKLVGRGKAIKTREAEKRILDLQEEGYSIREIAQRSNIPRSTVHDILSKKRTLNSDKKTGGGINKKTPPEKKGPFPDGGK